MRRRVIIIGILTLASCSAEQPPAAPPPAMPEAVTPPRVPQEYDNATASPRPTGAIVPPVPFPGDSATFTAQGLPPAARFEVWLVPTRINYRFGLPHPSQSNGVQLGTAESDADGALSLDFEMKPGYPDNQGTERGRYGIWLVYPDGKTLAPFVASWSAGNPTTFQGTIYDEQGRVVRSGARVKITVTGHHGQDVVTYATKEMEAVDGKYRFERMPAPANTVIEATLPSGVFRRREDGPGGMQIKWGCCEDPSYIENYGEPLTYHFGGPSTPEDPLAPAYFLSERLADPDFVWTTVSGRVFDQLGRPVPDAAQALVTIMGTELPAHTPFFTKVPVRDGTYQARVPIGVATFDLRVEPGVHVLIDPRPPVILAPTPLAGTAPVVNFGGPATEADPQAPNHPFPSPNPVRTGPSPFVPR